METDRPVASVSGGRDWEWNRWQAEVHARDAACGVSARHQPTDQHRSNREQIAELQRQLGHLEGRLERKDRRLQSVIDHYERLLREKNRELAAADPSSTADPDSTIVSAILRFAPID